MWRRVLIRATAAVAGLSIVSIMVYANSLLDKGLAGSVTEEMQIEAEATEVQTMTDEMSAVPMLPGTLDPKPTEESAEQSLIMSMDWGAEDSYLLAKIAMAEAESEDTEGKALVILVVLNRVWSDDFPDSIEEVILQDDQFSPVTEGGRWWTTEPDQNCWKALELIESGWDESEGALYFEAIYNGEDTWHSRNLEYIKTVGNHNFYR